MNTRTALIALLLTSALFCQAEPGDDDPSYAAEDLVVHGRETDGADMSKLDASPASWAATLPGVSLNAQGGPGGQSDLRIRGSTFSGAGFSLAGLSLNNAQTEHFNADLPLPPALFTRPEVLTGFDQTLLTEGHLVGTVNLRLRPIAPTSQLSTGLGEYESYWAHGLIEEPLTANSPAGGRLGLAAFGGHDRFNQVNYEDNDNENALGGGLLQWTCRDVQWDAVAGYRNKRFGARGYYGTNPEYPADEKTDDLLLLTSLQKGGGEEYFNASAAFRDFNDDYRLYMPTSLYHNEHETKTIAAQAGGRHIVSDPLGAVWRISADQEELTSDSLGNHRRAHGAMTLIPDFRAGRWLFAAGVRQEVFEREKPSSLPQAGITWNVAEGQSIALSAGRAVRRPSYTELNYESPASLGNQGLDPQFSDSVELNWSLDRDRWSLRGGPFVRRTRDTVDWIRATEESTRWTAENIGTVDSLGADAALTWLCRDDLNILASAAWLQQQADADVYSSRYALDYARAQARLEAQWFMNRLLTFSLAQGCRHQAENPLREHGSDQWLTDARMEIHPPRWAYARLVFSIENLWDDDFEEFPGQDTATGRRAYLGLTLTY